MPKTEYIKAMESSSIKIKPSFLIYKQIKLVQSININLQNISTLQSTSKKDFLPSHTAGKE
jgi:hypothetical protein